MSTRSTHRKNWKTSESPKAEYFDIVAKSERLARRWRVHVGKDFCISTVRRNWGTSGAFFKKEFLVRYGPYFGKIAYCVDAITVIVSFLTLKRLRMFIFLTAIFLHHATELLIYTHQSYITFSH